MDSIFFLIFRRMRVPLLTLLVAYAIAVTGLALIPGEDADGNPAHLGIFYSLYVMSYTATTIGFGEIPYPFTDAQRLWMIFCIYATVIAWLYSIGSLIALLQDRALQRAMQERRFSRRVHRLREPFYLVCGYGQTGSGLVRTLTDAGQRAVVLDNNPERIDLLRLEPLREFVPALRADVRQPDNLLLAGLKHPYCAGVLGLTSSNEANLKVALAAKLMHPNIAVICRADSPAIEANMASFGTNHIYDPFQLFALYLATALKAPCLTLLQNWLTEARHTPLRDPLYPPTKGLWVICGYGRFGKALYRELADQGLELIVIEATPERTGQPPGRLVHGPGTEAETLAEADIHRAVGLIAGTDNDANNLSIVMTALALNPTLFTVVRQNQLLNQPLFTAVGADILMHPSLIIAQRIRTLLGAPMLADFIDAARREDDAWSCALVSRISALVETQVPEVWNLKIDAEDAYAVDLLRREGLVPTIGDLLRDPRDRDRPLPAIVLLRQRGNHRTLLPAADEDVRGGDCLLFCGRGHARRRLAWTLQNCHALTYVMTGTAPRRGTVWRWLRRLTAARGAPSR